MGDYQFFKSNRDTKIEDINEAIENNDLCAEELEEVEDFVLDKREAKMDLHKATSLGRGSRGRLYKALYRGVPAIIRIFTLDTNSQTKGSENLKIFQKEFEMIM
jgi:hypothetical protein